MKKVLYILILITGIIGCKNDKTSYLFKDSLIPNNSLYSVLDSFVKENRHDNYLYELYIDKETPHNYLLTVYCGIHSLTEAENCDFNQVPLNYAMVSGVKFDIYSGAEHYLKIKDDTIKKIDVKWNYYEYNIWIVRDSFTVMSIYKDIKSVYPFVPLPVRFTEYQFTPPVLDSD